MPAEHRKQASQEQQQPESDDMVQVAPQNVSVSQGQNFFKVYVNNTEIGFTPWDIRLTLSEILGGDRAGIHVEKLGMLVMSPLHAKALLKALDTALSKYEGRFGKIELDRVEAQISGPSPGTTPQ